MRQEMAGLKEYFLPKKPEPHPMYYLTTVAHSRMKDEMSRRNFPLVMTASPDETGAGRYCRENRDEADPKATSPDPAG